MKPMAFTEPMSCTLHQVPFGQRCYWCQSTNWAGTWPPPSAATVVQGWQCPVCRNILSPLVAVCTHGTAEVETFITKGAGAVYGAVPAENEATG
jgi:hypothetical protein